MSKQGKFCVILQNHWHDESYFPTTLMKIFSTTTIIGCLLQKDELHRFAFTNVFSEADYLLDY